MIRVVVVDDQTLVRRGICSLLDLSPDIQVVKECQQGLELIEWLRQHQADVVLLDLRMPVCDGVRTLKQMAEQALSTPVIILTTFDDDEWVLASMEAGAKGYLLKDVELDTLVAAIKTVNAGGSVLKPVPLPNTPNKLAVDEQRHLETLSARELEVLQLMSAGFSNKEIGRALNLAEGTVKNYISAILAKIGVRDRTRAVLKAMEYGLL